MLFLNHIATPSLWIYPKFASLVSRFLVPKQKLPVHQCGASVGGWQPSI